MKKFLFGCLTMIGVFVFWLVWVIWGFINGRR